MLFTVGGFVLTVNAVLSFLPFIGGLKLPNGVAYVEGILSIMSCTLFLIGSAFAFVEAARATRRRSTGCEQPKQTAFGDSTDDLLEKGIATPTTPDEYAVLHHPSSNYHTLVHHLRELVLETEKKEVTESIKRAYTTRLVRFWGMVSAAPSLRTTLFPEISFVASAIFLSCSALYWATSCASLVTIFRENMIAQWIRYPQLVAAFGFIVASAMLMVKIQEKWWKPAVTMLGWHVNFWNLIGSVGFFFCAAFGIIDHVYWANFQFGCSYLWGGYMTCK